MDTPLSDPLVIATILGPVLGAAIGIPLDRAFKSKPKLIAYLGHSTSHVLPAAGGGGPPLIVNTHSLWVSNLGKGTANNVYLTHKTLTNIELQVRPPITYRVEQMEGDARAIVFPKLIGRGEVQIQYLAVNTQTDNIHVGCYSDEGAAKITAVKMQPVTSKLRRATQGALNGAGVAALAYVAFKVAIFAWGWIASQFV